MPSKWPPGSFTWWWEMLDVLPLREIDPAVDNSDRAWTSSVDKGVAH